MISEKMKIITFIKNIPCAAPPLLEISRQRITRSRPPLALLPPICKCKCVWLPASAAFSRSSQRKTMETNGHRAGSSTLRGIQQVYVMLKQACGMKGT